MGIVQRDGLKLTVISYFGVLLGYVNKVVLFPNFLDTEQLGLANILINISVIYAQFACLGTPGILLKFFPFFNDRNKGHSGFLFWCTSAITVGFLVVTLVFVLLSPWVSEHYSENSKLLVDYYYYVIPLALAATFYNLYDSYLRSLQRSVFPTLVNEIVLRLLLTLTITLYAFKLVSFEIFVVIYVAVNCLSAVLLMLYTAWARQLFIRPVVERKVKRFSRFMILFGMFSILSSAGNSFIANIDSLMVARYIDLSATGIYTTIFFISSVMWIPYRSILRITGPIVAEQWKARDMAAMEKLYKQVSTICVVLGCLMFVGLWVNMDNILYLMPDEFAAGKYVFFFVGLGRLFDMSTGLNGVITLTSKKYIYDLFFTIFLIIFTVVMNYIFIVTLKMGLVGAAIATMVTVVVYNLVRLYFVYHFFGMQPFEAKCLGVLAVTGACLGVNYLLPFVLNVYVDVLVRSALMLLLFGGAVFLFRLSPELNEYARKLLNAKQ